jgi:hypothetical protein
MRTIEKLKEGYKEKYTFVGRGYVATFFNEQKEDRWILVVSREIDNDLVCVRRLGINVIQGIPIVRILEESDEDICCIDYWTREEWYGKYLCDEIRMVKAKHEEKDIWITCSKIIKTMDENNKWILIGQAVHKCNKDSIYGCENCLDVEEWGGACYRGHDDCLGDKLGERAITVKNGKVEEILEIENPGFAYLFPFRANFAMADGNIFIHSYILGKMEGGALKVQQPEDIMDSKQRNAHKKVNAARVKSTDGLEYITDEEVDCQDSVQVRGGKGKDIVLGLSLKQVLLEKANSGYDAVVSEHVLVVYNKDEVEVFGEDGSRAYQWELSFGPIYKVEIYGESSKDTIFCRAYAGKDVHYVRKTILNGEWKNYGEKIIVGEYSIVGGNSSNVWEKGLKEKSEYRVTFVALKDGVVTGASRVIKDKENTCSFEMYRIGKEIVLDWDKHIYIMGEVEESGEVRMHDPVDITTGIKYEDMLLVENNR